MTYKVGNEEFATKDAVRERASEIINTTMHYELLEGDDLAFVSALFDLHPCAEEKAGVGLEGFFVGPGPEWMIPNLWLLRTDGETDNFSIGKCVRALRRHPAAGGSEASVEKGDGRDEQ